MGKRCDAVAVGNVYIHPTLDEHTHYLRMSLVTPAEDDRLEERCPPKPIT